MPNFEDVMQIIANDNVRFINNGLIHYLSTELLKNNNLNDHKSIEGAVKLLNSIWYFEYYNPSVKENVTPSMQNKLYNELSDRFALENSYEWVETYNSFQDDEELHIKHSCMETICLKESLKKMLDNNKLRIKRFEKFNEELEFRGFRDDYDNLTIRYSDKNFMNPDNSINSRYKKYLEIYYDIIGEDVSSLWKLLLPRQLTEIMGYSSRIYRVDDNYNKINDVFRDEDIVIKNISDEVMGYVINFMKLMVFPASLSEDLIVYRSDRFEIDTDVFKVNGFYSCSLSYNRAFGYVDKDKSYSRILKIRIPAGQQFLLIDSFGGGEFEIVLMPSTVIKKTRTCRKEHNKEFCDYVVESTYKISSEIAKTLLRPMGRRTENRVLVETLKDIRK